MLSKKIGAMRRRLGPVGLSVVAAALTAAAFAGVSVAAKDDGANKSNGNGEAQRAAPDGDRGDHPRLGQLSDEDKQKLEEFRQCMQDNGAPVPPKPGERSEGDGPPEPPSEEDRAAIEKGLEACEDKLPEGARLGPGGPGCHGPGGPPPGAPRQDGQQGQEQGTSAGSSASPAGPAGLDAGVGAA